MTWPKIGVSKTQTDICSTANRLHWAFVHNKSLTGQNGAIHTVTPSIYTSVPWTFGLFPKFCFQLSCDEKDNLCLDYVCSLQYASVVAN